MQSRARFPIKTSTCLFCPLMLHNTFQGLQKHVTVGSLRANITAPDTVKGLKNMERRQILWVISMGLMVHLVTVWKKWLAVLPK